MPWFTCVSPGGSGARSRCRDRLVCCQMWSARDEDSVTTGPRALQRSACKDSGRAAMWPRLLVSECRRDGGGGTRQAGRGRRGTEKGKSCHLGRYLVLCCRDAPQAVPRKGVGFEVVLCAPCGPQSLAVLTGDTWNVPPAALCRGTWKVQAGLSCASVARPVHVCGPAPASAHLRACPRRLPPPARHLVGL